MTKAIQLLVKLLNIFSLKIHSANLLVLYPSSRCSSFTKGCSSLAIELVLIIRQHVVHLTQICMHAQSVSHYACQKQQQPFFDIHFIKNDSDVHNQLSWLCCSIASKKSRSVTADGELCL